MALSQIQCLDDNNVNWRVNESKPEFFYSEDQRLALETLIEKGREDFCQYVKEHTMREFLSEPELERIARSTEVYKPGSDNHKTDAYGEIEDSAVSLQYWPDRSDTSIPELDMGWPDCVSYRGVTRVNVYTQPPMDGQTHIKEVVRKTIAQAQKVIAIVMDVFTDVDIFKDLLDAGFKRKVAIYIIIEAAGVAHFLSMCERARMHSGHLKNLRVRSCGGVEFYSRSAKKVRGSMSQKFMFVDGDRAVSGSYSFTWTASRLDRNLVTVMTGQAVETFDKQFRELYLTSRGVSLSKVPFEEVPEPDPAPVVVPAPVPSVAMARKLINPKYSLVSSTDTRSPASSDKTSTKNSSHNPMVKPSKPAKELPEAPPLHPGLHLEKVNMIPYLPTWPEPDPPSDVIGFINIRDSSRPLQTHLMRSEQFETSKAIRFKEPFTLPPQELPETACLRSKPENPPTEPPTTLNFNPNPIADLPVSPPPVPQPRMLQPDTEKLQDPGTPTVNVVKKADSQSETAPLSPNQSESIPLSTSRSETTPLMPSQSESISPSTSQSETAPLSKWQSEIADHSEKPLPAPPPPGGERQSQPQKEEDGAQRNHSHDNDAVNVTVTYDCSANDDASNVSTNSEEYYECVESDLSLQRAELLANGVSSGSGRMDDHRHADGVNLMARFSQSMLDLRPERQPNQEQKRDFQNQHQMYRDTGQLNHYSRFPSRLGQGRGASKGDISTPGPYHPSMPRGSAVGGHRIWQSNRLELGGPASGRSSPGVGHAPQRHASPHRTGPQPREGRTLLDARPLSKRSPPRNAHRRGSDSGGRGPFQTVAAQTRHRDRSGV